MSSDLPYFNGIGTAGARTKTIPVQTIPKNRKNKNWQKATMDALYQESIRQMSRNYVFADIRRMTQGEFTYRAVDIEKSFVDSPWAEKHYSQLKKDTYIPTHIKHFDFIGIIVNAISGIYSDMDDLYRVESIDEYSTNEYIRQRTEGLHQYAQAVFKAEIDRMLIANGLNPNKEDFQSEEEKQQYLQQLDATVKAYTPQEIENNLSKNFKVLATEWAGNVLDSDKKRFNLDVEDVKCLIDYILTGRWFRHYKVGYDYYDIERWRPEEVFFSQDLDCEYPQDLDYIGRHTRMSSNQLLQRYGFLMTTKQQEQVGNYWNQTTTYQGSDNVADGSLEEATFAKGRVVPFHNYYDHEINLQMEAALGAPLAKSMDEDGNVTREWMPRMENDLNNASTGYTQFLRDDIDVRTDSIEVMDVYWRSMKRVGILIYENEIGQPEIELTTDDLISDFLKEEEIKKLRNISMQELQNALKEDNITEYIGTISYHYIPEIWHGIMIKGNTTQIKEDILLDVRPLDYQIKGDSNLYQVRIPVGGIITNGIIPKILPFQQLHNICMNQNTELLSKELGVFFSLDINSLPSEYKDETTEEAIYAVTDIIKDTGILPLDPSRSNTQGSTVYPNIFQRNEVTFANQVVYRQQLAEYYKQQAYNQVGITPQMLGAPNTYTTAEGVKQGAQASYALMNTLIETFNTSKAKANEIHIAIAQFCETNGKETTKLTRKADHLLHFIDILAEDEELFPLRKLSVLPASNSRDRKIVEAIQNILINDNTVSKDWSDVVSILTNPYVLELKQIGQEMRVRADKKTSDQRQFESDQLDKELSANKEALEDVQAHEIVLQEMEDKNKIDVKYIESLGRDSASTKEDNFIALTNAYQGLQDNAYKEQELSLKGEEISRKKLLDIESKKKYLAELQLKREELQFKKEAKRTDLTIASINKN